MSEGPLHTLREALPPLDGVPAALYAGVDGPRLSLDSYFNSFSVPWHRRRVGAAEVFFEVTGPGPWNVSLWEWTPQQGRRRLVGARVEGRGVLPLAGARGRVWAEVEAERPGDPPAMRWATPQPPLRPVRLSVGIVTMGAEPSLGATLQALAAIAADLPELAKVFVVNHGGGPLPQALLADLPHDLFAVIDQPNLGGTGGFARTLAEAMSLQPAPSHHLMMDDDLRLDARMLPRLVRELAYAAEDAAVGGAMLDLYAPARMQEAGASLARHGIPKPFGRGVELDRPSGDDPAGRAYGANLLADPPQTLDFNGWWFFAVPLRAVRKAGLPPPLFLRGDDIDYARRLAAAGAPTRTPPGLAVWHEPFHAKAPSWQHYYDLRNRLIHGAVHRRDGEVRSRDLLERLLTPALSQDYATAEWRMLAVRHFLAGPKLLAEQAPQDLHRGVLAAGRPYEAPLLDAFFGDIARLPRRDPRRPATTGAHLKGFALAFGRLLLPQRSAPAAIIPDRAAFPAATGRAGYIREGGEAAWHRRHAPRRMTALRQVFAALWLALRHRVAGARARRRWAEGIDKLRAPDAWARRFGTER